MNSNLQNAIIASKLSEAYQWGAGINLPKPIDFFRNNNAPFCVSIGHSHFAVVTLEKELYTWAVIILCENKFSNFTDKNYSIRLAMVILELILPN